MQIRIRSSILTPWSASPPFGIPTLSAPPSMCHLRPYTLSSMWVIRGRPTRCKQRNCTQRNVVRLPTSLLLARTPQRAVSTQTLARTRDAVSSSTSVIHRQFQATKTCASVLFRRIDTNSGAQGITSNSGLSSAVIRCATPFIVLF